MDDIRLQAFEKAMKDAGNVDDEHNDIKDAICFKLSQENIPFKALDNLEPVKPMEYTHEDELIFTKELLSKIKDIGVDYE